MRHAAVVPSILAVLLVGSPVLFAQHGSSGGGGGSTAGSSSGGGGGGGSHSGGGGGFSSGGSSSSGSHSSSGSGGHSSSGGGGSHSGSHPADRSPVRPSAGGGTTTAQPGHELKVKEPKIKDPAHKGSGGDHVDKKKPKPPKPIIHGPHHWGWFHHDRSALVDDHCASDLNELARLHASVEDLQKFADYGCAIGESTTCLSARRNYMSALERENAFRRSIDGRCVVPPGFNPKSPASTTTVSKTPPAPKKP